MVEEDWNKPYTADEIIGKYGIPCTYAKFMKIIMTPRFDPYGVEKWKKKELAKHPEDFRPTTHPKDRVPGQLTEEEIEETLEEKYSF